MNGRNIRPELEKRGGDRNEVPRWEVRTLINSHGYFVRGIDLAKNVFAIHAVDEHGKAVLVRASVQRTWRRLLRVGDIFALLASRKVVQA